MLHALMIFAALWLMLGLGLALSGKTGFDIDESFGQKPSLLMVLMATLILIVISPLMLIHVWMNHR